MSTEVLSFASPPAITPGPLVRWFNELTPDDVPEVGGKNASLGELRRELTPLGIRVPEGFATTAEGYRSPSAGPRRGDRDRPHRARRH